jgi:hypothetical protein
MPLYVRVVWWRRRIWSSVRLPRRPRTSQHLKYFLENAATIELQSNLARSTNTSNAFARIKADSQALTFESGSGLAHDSKGDIVFSSIGDATKHMVIKGSTGKLELGWKIPVQP